MGDVAGETTLALDSVVKALDAGVEGFGERLQLAREFVADGLQWCIGVQSFHLDAGTTQYRKHVIHDQQTDAHNQRQCGKHRTQQGEVDVAFGLVPAGALGGDHQQLGVRAVLMVGQAGGQRASSMAVGKADIKESRCALAAVSRGQRTAPAVGGEQHDLSLPPEHGEELGMTTRIEVLHHVLQLRWRASFEGMREGFCPLQQGEVQSFVDFAIHPAVDHHEQQHQHQPHRRQQAAGEAAAHRPQACRCDVGMGCAQGGLRAVLS